MKIIQKPVARRKVFKFNFPQPPRSTQKVIELEKVCQSYGDRRVYENLDLLVERGERTVLVGPNGAGKSTLLKILAGIIPIDRYHDAHRLLLPGANGKPESGKYRAGGNHEMQR